ncbi:DNA/RNA helicase domain-containing protein [Allobacillus sp. GCM10007490]|uniref:ATP-binding protein n=1 Tax=Allobacillus sp. GCM10007490 TaxID=3317324 RepID=UPI0016432986
MHQLKKNHYYLSVIDTNYLCFTYVAQNEKFYQLVNNTLKEIDITDLLDFIIKQEIEYIDDLNKLFDPTRYLVSPFNSTEKFLEGRYFLTDHQENIKKDILATNKRYYSIEGRPGTGKTLLIYDISKSLMEDDKAVGIIHCANLNLGQRQLIEKGWVIESIRYYTEIFEKDIDVLILDETQRIRNDQFENIIEKCHENGIKCIIAFDPDQRLHNQEFKSGVPTRIKEISDNYSKLTNKIRTNKEIDCFIRNLFNLNDKTIGVNYTNIDVLYFSNIIEARRLMREKSEEEWNIIDYTKSRYKREIVDQYIVNPSFNAHNAIGQEFDNVIVLLGEMFSYIDDKLIVTEKSYYHLKGMLYQITTRARKKLLIIVVNNESLLANILGILK